MAGKGLGVYAAVLDCRLLVGLEAFGECMLVLALLVLEVYRTQEVKVYEGVLLALVVHIELEV